MKVLAQQETTRGRYNGRILEGRYYLRAKIGEGAEGVVYRAELRDDASIACAVKVGYTPLPEMRCADGLSGDPVVREHQVLSALSGPWFPRAVEVGKTAQGHSFAAREYMQGFSLSRLRARPTQFPRSVALAVGAELCAAVQALHRQGYVHRDLKPSNILIAIDDGRIGLRLLDFGSACPLRCEPPPDELHAIPRGTPAYMAPERAAGHPGGVSADIYSIGAVIYEVLTGTPALGTVARDATTARAYLAAGARIPARPLASLRTDLPPALVRTVERCMARDPRERGEWIAGIEQILRSHHQPSAADVYWLHHGTMPPRTNGAANSDIRRRSGARWMDRARLAVSELFKN